MKPDYTFRSASKCLVILRTPNPFFYSHGMTSEGPNGKHTVNEDAATHIGHGLSRRTARRLLRELKKALEAQ